MNLVYLIVALGFLAVTTNSISKTIAICSLENKKKPQDNSQQIFMRALSGTNCVADIIASCFFLVGALLSLYAAGIHNVGDAAKAILQIPSQSTKLLGHSEWW